MSDQIYFSMIGRLTRDADLKYTSSGMPVSNFSIACNQKYKDKEYVNYFDIELWGKRAESLEKYLIKGTQISVSGVPKQERWNDKNTGQVRSKVKFVANNIQLLSRPNQNIAQKNTKVIQQEFGGVENDPYNSPGDQDIPF